MSHEEKKITFPSVIDNKKKCPQCNETKDISEYHFTIRTTKRGKKIPRIKAYCKACCSKQRIAYHWDQHEKSMIKMQEWRDSNRNHINEYARQRLKIPSVLAYHSEKSRLRTAGIRMQELSLTEWEIFQTRFFYRVSASLTKIMGIKYNVDHRYPLSKGGKHHPSNLQIMTKSENCRKKDKIL